MAKRTVLIPLDGSAFSRQIMHVVRMFISPEDVRLVLFRAANPPPAPRGADPADIITETLPAASSYETYTRAVDAEFATASAQREEFRRRLVSELVEEAELLRNSGYSVSVEAQVGDAAQRIIDYVNRNNVDLVAMTTHGRSGLGKLVLGSVAEQVVRGVSVPVLLMRSPPEARSKVTPYEMISKALGNGKQLRIAAATDGSTLAQRAVGRAGELAMRLNAKLTLLVVAGGQDTAEHSRQLMEDTLQHVAKLDPRPEMVPLVGYPDEVILEYLAENPHDFLCIGAFQDRGAGSTTAIGPTAQRLVQYAPTSVLMYKGHRSQFRRILACVAVDDAELVEVAAQLAKAIGADLSVLHAIPPSAASYLSPAGTDESNIAASIPLSEVLSQGTHLSSLLKSWISQLEEHGIAQDAMLVQRGSVPEAILKTAHDGSFDLIIVGTHSTPGHFLGSVANGVVRYAEQPVLLLRVGGK